MQKKVLQIIVLSLVFVLFGACSSYQQLLKKGTPEQKYSAAKNYFLEKKYTQSATLFSEILLHYRGAKESEEIMFLLAESYMRQSDYYSAAEYYKNYIKSYPRGEYARQSKFMIGYCYYLDAPDSRLDQANTKLALNALQEYVDIYPDGDQVGTAYDYMAELKNKLAYKGYLNARLYLNLGTYLGNNYRAAILCAENAMKDYPETKYREDLSFIILSAKYKEASLSIAEKKQERYSEVIDEFYKYSTEFPDGKNSREASRMLREAKRFAGVN